MKQQWKKYFGIQELTQELVKMMRSKLIIITLIFTIMACSSYKGLPSIEEMPKSPFGSYIEIELENNETLIGELISYEDNKIYLITKSNNKCVFVEEEKVETYFIRFARPDVGGNTITLFTLLSLTHGFGLILTLPINLIVTMSITNSSYSEYKFNNEEINLEQLKMFARFPVGIPQHINIDDLYHIRTKNKQN